jgi:hypothetical protein
LRTAATGSFCFFPKRLGVEHQVTRQGLVVVVRSLIRERVRVVPPSGELRGVGRAPKVVKGGLPQDPSLTEVRRSATRTAAASMTRNPN